MSKRKKENNIERKAEDIVEVRPKEKHDAEMPTNQDAEMPTNQDAEMPTNQDAEMPPDSAALLNYDILFGNLNDLSKLKKENADFVSVKLKAHLQTQVLNSIGKVSDSMGKALREAVVHLDYQKLKDSQFSDVIKNILEDLKRNNEAVKEEAIKIENALADMPTSRSVKDLLHLDAPLLKNPILSNDINKAKTLEYAKLAMLNNQAAKNLVDKNLRLEDVDEDRVADLVKEGIILDEKQGKALHLVISLAKLTGDNLQFIKALKKGEETKSISNFVSWKKADWQKLIADQKIPLPPGETAETYSANIVFNIERTYPSQVLLSRVLHPKLSTMLPLLDS